MITREEVAAREAIAFRGSALAYAGLTPGTSGNISVRLDDGVLVTPTGSRLGELDPGDVSKVDLDGRHLSGGKPSKEAFLHLGMLRARPTDRSVVHLHSHNAVALSCLADVDNADVLPPITAYYVMRIGKLPMIPYFPPGELALAKAVEDFAAEHKAVLLSNHGPVVGDVSLEAASSAMEELEETAKLYFVLQGRQVRTLTEDQMQDLAQRFPS